MKKIQFSVKIKEEYSDLCSGIFALLVAAVTFFMTLSHTTTFSNSIIGPVAIPRAISIIIFIMGIGLIVNWALKRQKISKNSKPIVSSEESVQSQTDTEERKLSIFREITAPVSFLLLALYIFAMKHLGFTLASCLYLTLQIPLLSADVKPKSFLKAFLIGIVALIIIFVLFSKVFQLRLPTGAWGF